MIESQLIRLVPSEVSPKGVVDGEVKLSRIVELTPSCIYIESLISSQLIKLVPSKVSPVGTVAGEAKLLDMVEVIPSCI